jgi:hypothetical protein
VVEGRAAANLARAFKVVCCFTYNNETKKSCLVKRRMNMAALNFNRRPEASRELGAQGNIFGRP